MYSTSLLEHAAQGYASLPASSFTLALALLLLLIPLDMASPSHCSSELAFFTFHLSERVQLILKTQDPIVRMPQHLFHLLLQSSFEVLPCF